MKTIFKGETTLNRIFVDKIIEDFDIYDGKNLIAHICKEGEFHFGTEINNSLIYKGSKENKIEFWLGCPLKQFFNY